MSILKSSITAVAIVVGVATVANAAPRHHQATQHTAVQPYTNEPLGAQFEGNYGVPNSAIADDANTRAAESFQDQFRNGY
jgi:hypothetical protein